jgi:hypothetical protein
LTEVFCEKRKKLWVENGSSYLNIHFFPFSFFKHLQQGESEPKLMIAIAQTFHLTAEE